MPTSPLPTTVLSLLQDKGAGGSSAPRCTHRPLGPFSPASATPGLYNQQSGPWGRVEGVGGGQGWAVPPGPGLATGRQPILRMECRATVQQPRSSELML